MSLTHQMLQELLIWDCFLKKLTVWSQILCGIIMAAHYSGKNNCFPSSPVGGIWRRLIHAQRQAKARTGAEQLICMHTKEIYWENGCRSAPVPHRRADAKRSEQDVQRREQRGKCHSSHAMAYQSNQPGCVYERVCVKLHFIPQAAAWAATFF